MIFDIIAGSSSGLDQCLSIYNPASLFLAGEKGVWFDPSDLSTMFQDSTGTIPVTADGQSVGLIRDKSGNSNHASQTNAVKRPIYKASGGLHWLQFDGVDDALSTGNINLTTTNQITGFVGCNRTLNSGSNSIYNFMGDTETVGRSANLSLPLESPGNMGISCRGTTTSGWMYPNILAKNVFSAQHNLGGVDFETSNVLRVNGAYPTLGDPRSMPTTGGGTFGNGPLTLGNVPGISFYFGGHIFSIILIDRLGTMQEITSTEQFLACRSGVTLP